MKKFLLVSAALALISAPALAADLTTYEPAAVEAPVAATYNWTGFYAGVFGGVGTGDFDYDVGVVGGPSLISGDLSAGGALGGIQIGYDWQVNSWVFGAVADIAKTNIDVGGSIDIGGDTLSAESELDYLGTVRGRIGYAFDRALVYGHGGFAYGKTEQTVSINGADLVNESQSRTGWTVGAGIEYAITDQISFGTEYSYVDLGKKDLFNDGVVYANEDVRFHTVKAAINYRF